MPAASGSPAVRGWWGPWLLPAAPAWWVAGAAAAAAAAVAAAAALALRLAAGLPRPSLADAARREATAGGGSRAADGGRRRARGAAAAGAESPQEPLGELEDLAAPEASSGQWGQGEVRRPVRAAGGTRDEACDVEGLPGSQRVFLKTYGCAHNGSDAEFMLGLLRDYGYALTDQLEDAHVCVVNSCTVKGPSEDNAVSLARRAQKEGKTVVMTGCVPSGDKSIPSQLPGVSMLSVTQINRIVEVVEEASRGSVVQLLGSNRVLPSLELPKVRRNNCVEIIPISGGCLGNCSYCKTKHARGKLSSYTEEAIVSRALQAAAEGASQVWLTSEDTGAYGLDIGTHIGRLLPRVADALPPGVMLKLGMTNPPYMLAHIDAVAAVLGRPNVFAVLHVPVQSGSDSVLRAMIREYSVAEFRQLVDGLRAAVPDMRIATDMICGFPAESEEDHEASMSLVREYRFPELHISQFYPRPGTAAARMKGLPGSVKKRRSTEMHRLFESYQTYGDLPGREERVWFSDTDARWGQTVGHTKTYAKVVVQQDDSLLGRSALVRLGAASKWHVEGQVLGLVR